MGEREFQVGVAQLVQAVNDRKIGKVVELVDDHRKRSLIPCAKHLAKTAFLLHVHQHDFADRRRLNLEEIGRELDVDELVLLEDVFEDDIGRIGVDDRREKLVDGDNNAGKAFMNVSAQSPHVRLDFARGLLVERMVKAVVESLGVSARAAPQALEADRDVLHDKGKAVA